MVDGNFLPARGGFLQFIRRGNICRTGLAASAAVSALRIFRGIVWHCLLCSVTTKTNLCVTQIFCFLFRNHAENYKTDICAHAMPVCGSLLIWALLNRGAFIIFPPACPQNKLNLLPGARFLYSKNFLKNFSKKISLLSISDTPIWYNVEKNKICGRDLLIKKLFSSYVVFDEN